MGDICQNCGAEERSVKEDGTTVTMLFEIVTQAKVLNGATLSGGYRVVLCTECKNEYMDYIMELRNVFQKAIT